MGMRGWRCTKNQNQQKPANVLVNEAGEVTLLDFGVAKLLDGERTAATALTEVAGRAFTPDYASPEQIRGEPLGTGSDIYSLGVLAFELLAGARPYRLQRGTAAELEEAIMQTDPPRPSDLAATPAQKKALRGDLDAILGKALKKLPQDRYASVDALAQDLQRHLRREPVLARPDGAGYRLARFVGRHRLAVSMGTALGLTVLAGSSAALWQAREARAHERRANAELRRQHAVQDLYIETLSRLTVLGTEEPEALSKPGGVSAVLMERLKDFEKRNADNPEALGAQLESVMIQLNYDARFAESLAVGQQLLQHQKAHNAPADDVLNTYASLGRTLQKLGRQDESEAMRREGLRWAPEVRDPESDSIRLTLATDLGDLLINKGQRAEALQVLTEADRIARETFAEDHLRYDTLISLAHFYLGFDDVKGLELMRQSEAEIAHLSNLDADYRANFAWWMSDALAANGDLAAAEAQASRAVALYRQTTGREGRMAQRALSRLASVVAHREPARATALLAQERQWFAARPDGIQASTERLLRARELEAATLAGDVTTLSSLAQVNTGPLLKTPMPLDGEALLTQLSRALVLAGRGEQALPLAEAVFAKQAARKGGVTIATVSAELTLAQAQLAAGRPAASGRRPGADPPQLPRGPGAGRAGRRRAQGCHHGRYAAAASGAPAAPALSIGGRARRL
jgi:Protein kinase domain